MRKIFYSILSFILILTFAGCATKKYQAISTKHLPSIPGIYHKVKKGETLWSISKKYSVDLERIVNINKIPNASKINTGQSLFIPYAKQSSSTTLLSDDSGFIWPVKGKVAIHFGMKCNGVKSKGIYIKAKQNTDVVAIQSGKVSFCDDKLKGRGKTIIINHKDAFVSVYAHNSKNLVKVGDIVNQGQRIAKVGSTGRIQSSQLYFEIRKGHIPKNPFYYLP